MLVIGGGDIAARKIMFLRRAGANVQVVAAALSEEVAALLERQEIQWRAHEFEEQQLDDVFLAIAATDDDALNQRVSAAANARYRLVNVVD
ncbi:sirohydrochlorin ferrochelatase, partial [Raoultella planticola]